MKGTASPLPRIGITAGDPRGIGPEILRAVLRDPPAGARFLVLGPADVLEDGPGEGGSYESRPGEGAEGFGPAPGAPEVELEAVGAGGGPRLDETEAGRLAGLAIERGIELASAGALDGLVTAPISKAALARAGWRFPGHTELLRERTGVPEVTMMMTAERTPLGGPIRMALLTAHVPLREVPDRLDEDLVVRRGRIAVDALRRWWGIERPRIALAGLNPHAGEGGLLGDEESKVLEPAARRLAAEGEAEVSGIFPADTAFRRTIEGKDDLLLVPYHDVGLAVLKTVARDSGVNVTAGLPFPRTAPDHGTAFDIAGRGLADPGSMTAAVELCVRFCRRAAGAGGGGTGSAARTGTEARTGSGTGAGAP